MHLQEQLLTVPFCARYGQLKFDRRCWDGGHSRGLFFCVPNFLVIWFGYGSEGLAWCGSLWRTIRLCQYAPPILLGSGICCLPRRRDTNIAVTPVPGKAFRGRPFRAVGYTFLAGRRQGARQGYSLFRKSRDDYQLGNLPRRWAGCHQLYGFKLFVGGTPYEYFVFPRPTPHPVWVTVAMAGIEMRLWRKKPRQR